MPLNDVTETLARQIESIAEWEAELLKDLEKSRQRRERLQQSLVALYPELVTHRRAALRTRMNRVASKLSVELRSNLHQTDKVEAVHGYLARADGVVSVRMVQKFLERHDLAPGKDAAAMILHRKAKQGVVTRVSRGRYRVNHGHPKIAMV